MLAAMSSHRNQMNSLLYWLIPSMIYFNILYLDNSVALEEYYAESDPKKPHVFGNSRFPNDTGESRLFIEQLGFTVMVHQLNLTSAIVFKNESTVYMADTFEQGNPMRSFRIVGANSDQNELRTYSYNNLLGVLWSGLYYCELNTKTYADIYTYFFDTGAIAFYIKRVYNPNDNCNMTIVFADGHYEGSKDGNGTIVDEKVIFKKVIPGSSIVEEKIFIFIPLPTCQEHTSKDACITKTRGKLNCNWCKECKTCVLKESPCSCLDQTETTESQPLKTGSRNIYYIVGIVTACIFIVLFIVGMIVCRYKIPNHQFNCQPCMTWIGGTLH
uniref:Uncharacterized protein n=1 Tax=Schistosoma japonicum TaxID=6182 RepID=C1LMT4_SCHJA|nr:hypothetical protein [Schistosoma japonicum]